MVTLETNRWRSVMSRRPFLRLLFGFAQLFRRHTRFKLLQEFPVFLLLCGCQQHPGVSCDNIFRHAVPVDVEAG